MQRIGNVTPSHPFSRAASAASTLRLARLLALPSLVLCLLAFAAAPAVAQIVVNEANDDENGNSLCSLREAVEAANTNAAVDGCTAGTNDGDTITFNLAAGTLIIVNAGELLISDDVNIDASGSGSAGVTLDAQGNSRIFDVNVTDGDFPGTVVDVTFQSLSLMNGNSNVNSSGPNAGGAVDVKADDEVTFIDVSVAGSVAGVNGGGIHAAGGTMLTITTTNGGSSTISNNEALGDAMGNGGGGVWGAGSTTISGNVTISGNTASGATMGSGGGVFNQGGTLDIQAGVTISNNTANRAGGGIEDNGGISTTLSGVTVTGNTATGAGAAAGNGGGLHSGGGDVSVISGSITDNMAVEGGGIWTNSTLTTSNGLSITGNTATGAAANQGGGGLYTDPGSDVTLGRTTIDNNTASGASGSGGGILISDNSSVQMTLGSVSGNTANRAGGGIEIGDDPGTNNLTELTLMRVTVDGNMIGTPNPGNGGGLHIGGQGETSVLRSTFSNNTAVEGGGLWASGASSLLVRLSTVSGNEATGSDGGGVYDDGVAGRTNAITLTSVTVANNTASGGGGGVLGTGTGFVLGNTIVGGNTAGGAGNDASGTFTSNDFNLIEDPSGFTFAAGPTDNNITGQDPALMPLADNGGPTLTHKLAPPSPAADAGSNLTGQDTDQRGSGFPRTTDSDADNASGSDGTDIGALEVSDGTIPVELAAFDARLDDADVVLQWRTATEANNQGFQIEYRRQGESTWTESDFVKSQIESGNSAEPLRYEHRLSGLNYGTYTFHLVQQDRDGDRTELDQFTPTVEVMLDEAFSLTEAYPNPVRGGRPATVKLTVRAAQDLTVALYDALGRQVRTLHEGPVKGQQTLPLFIEAGSLSSGMYLLRATGEDFSTTRKIVLVR